MGFKIPIKDINPDGTVVYDYKAIVDAIMPSGEEWAPLSRVITLTAPAIHRLAETEFLEFWNNVQKAKPNEALELLQQKMTTTELVNYRANLAHASSKIVDNYLLKAARRKQMMNEVLRVSMRVALLALAA